MGGYKANILGQNDNRFGLEGALYMFHKTMPVWDLLVDSRDGELVLAVEIRRKTNVSPEWAAKFRRNILSDGNLPKAPYFLMVFPDKFYLWSDVNNQDGVEPTLIDANPILQPYFERAGITAENISDQSLELIILSWLEEIIHSERLPKNIDSSQQWLLKSGLYGALLGGEYEAAA
jgi:hypothetical protein